MITVAQQQKQRRQPDFVYRRNNKDKENDNEGTSLTSIWKTLQENPGGLIILPFVIIFGLDLLLNIFFITKRSFEYFVLGQAPSQETWY